MLSRPAQDSIGHGFGHAINRIDFLQSRISQQAQAGNTKVRVEDINHVTCSVRDAAHVRILTFQDEFCQLGPVDPVHAANHGHATHDPPAVAHVFKLFGPAVEAAIRKLPLAKPASELVDVDEIETVRDGERTNAGEHLTRMRFCSWPGSKSAVKVGTRLDVLYCLFDIDQMHQTKQGEGIERTV